MTMDRDNRAVDNKKQGGVCVLLSQYSLVKLYNCTIVQWYNCTMVQLCPYLMCKTLRTCPNLALGRVKTKIFFGLKQPNKNSA